MNTAIEEKAISRPLVKGPHGPVPYIARWSEEVTIVAKLVATSHGLVYAGELPTDRDEHGVLWPRVPSTPGAGEPLYADVHPLRLRRAMHRLLCQVCASPADNNAEGTLWVLPEDGTFDWSQWPERLLTTHAPVCLRCAHISVKRCPAVKRKHLIVRAHSVVIGVASWLYLLSGSGLRLVHEHILVEYGSPYLRWTVAKQVVRELRDCQVVTL